MTDKKLKELIEDCCNDIFDRLEPLANVKSRLYTSLKASINNKPCCKSDIEQLLAYTKFLRDELHLNISDTWVESYVEDSK